jgi:hypothetical protein
VPSPETCNGFDDDCDEDVDEDFECAAGRIVPCTTACGTVGSGECSAACDAPADAACVPPDEVCNDTDDDCDGVVDEGVARLGAPNLFGSETRAGLQMGAVGDGTFVVSTSVAFTDDLELRRVNALGATLAGPVRVPASALASLVVVPPAVPGGAAHAVLVWIAGSEVRARRLSATSLATIGAERAVVHGLPSDAFWAVATLASAEIVLAFAARDTLGLARFLNTTEFDGSYTPVAVPGLSVFGTSVALAPLPGGRVLTARAHGGNVTLATFDRDGRAVGSARTITAAGVRSARLAVRPATDPPTVAVAYNTTSQLHFCVMTVGAAGTPSPCAGTVAVEPEPYDIEFPVLSFDRGRWLLAYLRKRTSTDDGAQLVLAVAPDADPYIFETLTPDLDTSGAPRPVPNTGATVAADGMSVLLGGGLIGGARIVPLGCR